MDLDVPTGTVPSPPPCGWSFGFITEPRTVGRIPIWRLRPALPMLIRLCSAFPTCPIVCAAYDRYHSHLAGRHTLNVAYFPSFAISCALFPAERTNCPPCPDITQCCDTCVPTGISVSSQAVTNSSAVSPFITSCQLLVLPGARIYALLTVWHSRSVQCLLYGSDRTQCS